MSDDWKTIFDRLSKGHEQRLSEFGRTVQISLSTQVRGSLPGRNMASASASSSGAVVLSNAAPLDSGITDAGSGTAVSRWDHTHDFQVIELQGQPVSAATPASLDYLQFLGGSWTPAAGPTLADLTGTRSANFVLAGPASGGAATPTFRALVLADLPSGTAKLATAQEFSAANSFSTLLRANVTSGTTGYGIRFWDGTNDFGNFQALDLGGTSYLFFGTNRQFDGTAWQQLNTRVGGILQITGDVLTFNNFPASSSVPTSRFRIEANGNTALVGGASYGASSVGVIGVANRNTAPTGNPTAGGVLYAASGGGTWRGSGGTVTTFGPAGPHCGACGYDAWTVAMRNDAWQAYCYICGHCGATYTAGPQSVLDRLSPEEQAQIIRVDMSYAELAAMLD